MAASDVPWLGPRIREEAEAADLERDRSSPRYSGERRLHLLQPLIRPPADKLRGDMQVGRWAPCDVGGGAKAVQQRFEIADNVRRQI